MEVKYVFEARELLETLNEKVETRSWNNLPKIVKISGFIESNVDKYVSIFIDTNTFEYIVLAGPESISITELLNLDGLQMDCPGDEIVLFEKFYNDARIKSTMTQLMPKYIIPARYALCQQYVDNMLINFIWDSWNDKYFVHNTCIVSNRGDEPEFIISTPIHIQHAGININQSNGFTTLDIINNMLGTKLVPMKI